MTLNILQLSEHLTAAQFSEVEKIDDSIIRCVKKSGELPFAVYYLDVAQNLPETSEALNKYQDRIIGKRYFEGRKSLQWSNYLYFITSRDSFKSKEVRQAKELIERDRSYARKLVISEEELDSVLSPCIVVPEDATPHANILSVWTKCLAEAGLDEAIMSDNDLPTRLKLIEGSHTTVSVRAKAPRKKIEVNPEQFINSIELKKFRDFPRQQRFEFGTVNLIFGANGSGKTSLLEAIELFYCGRNKRNLWSPPSYELTAVFADGRSEKVTARRSLSKLRDRNLAWYGQSEIKTVNLYQSFAQFNFLDTDAAVSLTDTASRIKDDISKLLAGPDASKTWRNIERVCEFLWSELRGLRLQEEQIKEELVIIKKQLEEAISPQQESDSIRVRLEEMINRLGWSVAMSDKEALATTLAESLIEVVSLAQQASSLDWAESPVTMDNLAKYCHEAKDTYENAKQDITMLEILWKNQRSLTDMVRREREALDLAKKVERLIVAGIHHRDEERNKLHSTIAIRSDLLAGIDVKTLKTLSNNDLRMDIATYYDVSVSKKVDSDKKLADIRSKYDNFINLQNQSFNLSQELRNIASKIIVISNKPNECPLCHTKFVTGELEKHIVVGVDQHLETLAKTLFNQLMEQEKEVKMAADVMAASFCLKKFCSHADLDPNTPVNSVLSELEKTKCEHATSLARIEILNSEIHDLEFQGLSMASLIQFSDRLCEIGYPLAENSQLALDSLLATINRDFTSSSQQLEIERTHADELQKAIEVTLGLEKTDICDLKTELLNLNEKLITTENILLKLKSFSASFPWNVKRSLSELSVEAESIRKVAAEMLTVLSREKHVQTIKTESIERITHLEKKLNELSTRINRLSNAHSTLDGLKRTYSLEKVMEAALQRNQVGIETIFLRIHSPSEFSGLGSTISTLKRKSDGGEARINEISSGQRAAFALSIFLAQNAQLTVAPPVILMDDPIAHVDDLNSLSFLDYLRELALIGKRQIYFATANAKLASLFERKFDFLGEKEFRRFDLVR